MTVIIGSARGDENGRASGGKAGDQKQKSKKDYSGEVSFQKWYKHAKGWVLLRAIDPEVRRKIAQDMIWACENELVGYDQGENRTLYAIAKALGWNISKVDKPCETDCAQLVRVTILYAGVEDPAKFVDTYYTATLPEALVKTGAFKKYTAKKYTEADKALEVGDILCTPVKGHVVVVCYTDADDAPEQEPVKGPVKDFQEFLNDNYPEIVKITTGDEKLEEDNSYGAKTRAAAVGVWKYMANKYYGAGLTVGNPYFYQSSRIASDKMTDEEIRKHPTIAFILQGILAGRGAYPGPVNGKLTDATQAAVKSFQEEKHLPADGSMDPDTWFALFN